MSIIESKLLPFIWILIVIKLIFSVYNFSEKERYNNNLKYWLKPSSYYNFYLQDTSDFEWLFWKNSFIDKLWPWFFLHIILSQIFKFKSEIRSYTYILMFVIYYVQFVGALPLIFFLVLCFSILLIAEASRSFQIVWFVSGFILCLNNIPFLRKYLNLTGMLCSNDSLEYLFQEYSISLLLMRLISCSHFIIKLPKEKKINLFLAFDITLYICYLPFIFSGPFMPFDDFRIQIKSPPEKWTLSKFFKIIFMFLRAIFWTFVLETASHFLYHSALLRTPNLITRQPLLVVAGSAYLVGQFFMVKYVVIWLVATATSLFDGLNPPKTPQCISYVYSYTDMWKYFDRGLYQFMKIYIYTPLGGSRFGLFQQIISTFCCFLFVYIWHGCTWAIFFWSLLNFISLILELLICRASKLNFFIDFKNKLCPVFSNVIDMMLIFPTLFISTYAIFMFLCGIEVSIILIRRLCFEDFLISFPWIVLSSFALTSCGMCVRNYKKINDDP